MCYQIALNHEVWNITSRVSIRKKSKFWGFNLLHSRTRKKYINFPNIIMSYKTSWITILVVVML
jgi:hypothetical protein